MKVPVKLLLSLALLLAVSGLILSFGDPPLDPEIETFLARTRDYPPKEENGFYALMAGIEVAPEDDPRTVGEQIVQKFESALAANKQGRTSTTTRKKNRWT